MATGAGDPDAACRDLVQFDTKAGRGMRMGNGGLEGGDGSLVALALAFSVLRVCDGLDPSFYAERAHFTIDCKRQGLKHHSA